MNIDLIRFAPLFLGLTEQEREAVTAGFVSSRVAANANLFQVGEQSEALYLIEKGFVRLATASGQNLATLGPGSVLGEATFFRTAPQDVTAIAASDLEVWKLADRKLREILLQNPMIGLKLSQNFGTLVAQLEDYLVQRLGQTVELSSLPRHTLQAVAAYLEPRTVRASEQLFRSGEPPTALYLIESGAIELRNDGTGSERDTQKAPPGTILGALALLTNKLYVSTAVALEDSLLWVLSAESFQAVNSRHPGLRRSFGRHVRGRLSKQDQSQAMRRLTQMPIFAEVPPATMQSVAGRLMLQHVPAGERVYRVGESGDALYLIEHGEIELTEENASGVVEEKARIAAGGFFGEMSLLAGLIRTEDATATRNTNLWVLHKADLDELTTQHPALGRALSQGVATRLADGGSEVDEERFRKFELLSDLNATDLRPVVERLRPTRYRAGDQIYRVNTPPETLYLIEKGNVHVQPLSGLAWSLGPGEAFGERALLTNQPHNTTVTAESDVDAWTLSKQDFEMLMNRYPSLAINMSRMLSQRVMHNTNAEPVYEGVMPTPAAAVRRRHAAAAQASGPAPAASRGGIGQWYSNLSGWGKLRFVLLILLILFLLGITVPTLFLSLVWGPARATSSISQALSAVYSMGSYEVAAADSEVALALAMVDSQVPPTPTYTPPPTNTPLVTPTSPPAETATPQPTAFSQFIPAAQQQPIVAPPVAAPAEESPPEEAVQAAAAPSRVWDSRLDQLGVRVEEAAVGPGQPYFKLIEARWADEQESGGKHHIYVEVLDENGARIVGQPVTVTWAEGVTTGPVEDKAPPDFGFNFQMYAAGYAYTAKVEGLPSDMITGAGMGSIEQRMYGIHTSFYLIFQRSVR